MVGVDLVYIPEFEHQMTVGGAVFLDRAFHHSERRQLKVEHLAGIWAAKEAIMKAYGMKAGTWLDITIDYAANGQPLASANGRSIEISISHHGDYAVAVALAL